MQNPKYINMFLRKFFLADKIQYVSHTDHKCNSQSCNLAARIVYVFYGKDNHPTKLISVQKSLQDEDGFTVEGEEYTN